VDDFLVAPKLRRVHICQRYTALLLPTRCATAVLRITPGRALQPCARTIPANQRGLLRLVARLRRTSLASDAASHERDVPARLPELKMSGSTSRLPDLRSMFGGFRKPTSEASAVLPATNGNADLRCHVYMIRLSCHSDTLRAVCSVNETCLGSLTEAVE
jgi:hypothetical protein